MRILCWFSCGAASAVAAKKALEKYPTAEILYCNTLAYEHPDNLRFLKDVETWLGQQIKILHSKKYTDIFDVFEKTKFLVGPKGRALCTIELKKRLRFEYQRPNDLHVFGFTREEEQRIKRLTKEDVTNFYFPLFEQGITKIQCHQIIKEAGIAQPEMYRLGFRNNNCIGCVKGGAGYWNHVRKIFPEAFERMAKLERKLGATILSDRRKGQKRARLYLDELDPNSGRMEKEPNTECGVLCQA